jgi:hypothetical protein
MGWGEPKNGGADASLVAVMIELMNNPPEVSIPFGNTIVQTMNDDLTYTRASTATYINKSGVLTHAAVDDIRITSNGLLIEGESANLIIHNDKVGDISNGWGLNACTVVSTSQVNIDGSNVGATTMQANAGTGEKRPIQDSVSIGVGRVTVSVFVKYENTQFIRLMLNTANVAVDATVYQHANFDLVNKTVTGIVDLGLNAEANIEESNLFGGYIRVSLSFDSLVARTSTLYLNFATGETTGSIDTIGTEQVTYTFPQVEMSESATSVILTEATPVTRAPDIASIPIMNNMPAAGQPFTIMCDVAVPDDLGGHGVFSFEPIASQLILLWRTTIGAVNFNFHESDGTPRVVSAGAIDGEKHRITISVDSVNMSIYIDGVLIDSKATNGDYPNYAFTKTIEIGKFQSKYLNSEIRNFKIYHRALSDAQIAALGAAE